MREKIKKHIKKIVPFICIFTMLCGSVLTVNAKQLPSSPVGERFANGVQFSYNNYSCLSHYYITDSTKPVYTFYYFNESMTEFYRVCFSEESFKLRLVEYANGALSKLSSLEYELDWNSSTERQLDIIKTPLGKSVYAYITSSSIPYFIVGSTVVDNIGAYYIGGNNYGDVIDGIIDCTIELQGVEYKDSSFDGDLTGALSNTNLGYLHNITYATYMKQNEEGYPVDAKYVIGWDNTHEEWDSTYKVAHYVKVRADIRSLNKTDTHYSDLIFVDDALYSDCNSYFINSDLTNTEEYTSFIQGIKDKTPILGNYITGYIHYLVIYHETENGIEYGYWNQVISDDFEGVSVGKVPSYGVMDSEWEFVEIEKFDRLEDYEIGVGDSIEDAENNAESVRPNFDSIPSFETIGDFMEYFQNMMSKLFDTIGSLPKYVGELFSFLPAEVTTCLALGLLIAIILRVVGR